MVIKYLLRLQPSLVWGLDIVATRIQEGVDDAYMIALLKSVLRVTRVLDETPILNITDKDNKG